MRLRMPPLLAGVSLCVLASTAAAAQPPPPPAAGAETNLTSSLATAFPDLIHPTGYFQTTLTPLREVGVNVHYAWGSR
jgi:hypothetical protein